MKIYLVGGHVRDKVLANLGYSLIDSNANDRDFVVVGATVEDMLAADFQQVGAHFPVFLHPETKEEYALARREKKSGDKHTDFIVELSPDITLAEDAQRRDFTINALYQDLETGQIIDPTGTGISDCTDGILRHAGLGFSEDPLRVLRCARLAAQLGFSVANQSIDLIEKMVKNDMLQHLSRERIDNEFTRAMSPGYDSVVFLQYLQQWGVLTQLYPELEALAHTVENPSFHWASTTWEHVLAALDVVRSQAPAIKTATIYHDIYKPISYERKKELGYHISHDDDDAVEYLRSHLAQRMFPKHTKQLCKIAVRYHMRMWMLFSGMSAKKWVDMIAAITHGYRSDYLQQLHDLLEICKADDLSDKTPTCYINSGGKNRWKILQDSALQTFEVCHNIQARSIEGYQDMKPALLIEKLRRARIAATKAQVDYFASQKS